MTKRSSRQGRRSSSASSRRRRDGTPINGLNIEYRCPRGLPTSAMPLLDFMRGTQKVLSRYRHHARWPRSAVVPNTARKQSD